MELCGWSYVIHRQAVPPSSDRGDGRAVDTYIKKIRKLIAPLDYIKTIRKSGYIFSKGEH